MRNEDVGYVFGAQGWLCPVPAGALEWPGRAAEFCPLSLSVPPAPVPLRPPSGNLAITPPSTAQHIQKNCVNLKPDLYIQLHKTLKKPKTFRRA